MTLYYVTMVMCLSIIQKEKKNKIKKNKINKNKILEFKHTITITYLSGLLKFSTRSWIMRYEPYLTNSY